MYQATVYRDSPAVEACRKLLIKQRLSWEEETTLLNDKPAIHIIVSNVKDRLKPVRTKSASVKVSSGIVCEQLAVGLYRWVNGCSVFLQVGFFGLFWKMI